MKQQSGFTLIELVIVIIILGILAATAVPKFVDLQSDARESAMTGVKGALESAATLTYSRAAIDGKEDEPSGETANDVDIVFGYPAATSTALSTAAGLSDTDWDLSTASAGGGIVILPAGGTLSDEDDTGCNVTYDAATSVARPTITAYTGGC